MKAVSTRIRVHGITEQCLGTKTRGLALVAREEFLSSREYRKSCTCDLHWPFPSSLFCRKQALGHLGVAARGQLGCSDSLPALGPFATGTALIRSSTLSALMSKNGIIDCFQTKRDFGAGRGCTWCLLGLSSGIQNPGELKCGFS